MLLDLLFEHLSVRVQPFAVYDIEPGGRLRLDGLSDVTLHFVLSGQGRLRGGKTTALALRPDTLVVVPPRLRHTIDGDPVGSPAWAGATDVAVAATDDPLTIACGRVEVTYGETLGLFDLLEAPLALDFASSPDMERTFTRLLEETRRQGTGSRAMMAALMSECLVLVFRALCDHPDCPLPWLTALEDPRLGPPLGIILARPELRHSVESLARCAGMSRSAFAREFTIRFGRTPMAFVREVRLRRAAELLRTTMLSTDSIADRVGFGSRSHFSRAFADRFGVAPAEFRSIGGGGGQDGGIGDHAWPELQPGGPARVVGA